MLFSKTHFFPVTMSEWNKLDPSLRNSESFLTFKKNVIQFIRPAANSVYNCHNPKGIKLITRLRLGESLNPLCNCGDVLNPQTIFFSTVHYSPMKEHSPHHFK